MKRSITPGDWLLAAGEQHSEAIAVTSGQRQTRYRQLSCEAASLAQALADVGICRGQVVALQTGSSQQIAALLYAALHLGVALMPLDPAMEADRRDRLLESIGCDWLVVSGEGGGGIPAQALFSAAAGIDPSRVSPGRPLARDQVQLIIATSGTTGQPKGVMLSAANLSASVTASRQRLGLAAEDCWLACLPLFHIGGLSILLRTLEAAAHVHLLDRFTAEAVWAEVGSGRVSHLSLVPAMLDRLLTHAGKVRPPAALRAVLVGGGPLSTELARRARRQGWPLCVSYGMSETASQFATDCSATAGEEPGQVGLPLPGYQVRLAGDGRIRVRGPAVMLGYANREREPGGGLEQGWYETGDLGRIDEAGRLQVIGRADDLLVSGGRNIHPAEVEARLLQCPGVTGVGVTGREDPVWGVVLVALFTGEVTERALEQWSRNHLPGPLRPRQFVAVSALPLNTMGKLYRPGLRQLITDQD
ncbi:MAG: AMP-binding protein [Sedimenticola sp.]|nr:AMP-binding protein [Sedimenticola sp.]